MNTSYTWTELDTLANNLRYVRDNHIENIPLSVLIPLFRNLKVIEQEIRILSELDNFLSKNCSGDEYLERHDQLIATPVNISIRKIALSDFGDADISMEIMEKIYDFVGE